MWTFHASRASLYLAAFAAAAIGLGMNFYFWFQSMAADPIAQKIWCAACVLSVFFKIAAPIAAAVQRVSIFKCGPLTALFIVALTFDIISGLGFSAMTKAGAARDADRINEARAELQTEHDELKRSTAVREKELTDKLVLVTAARVTGTVESELTNARRLAGDCELPKLAYTRECRTVARLSAEIENAKARDGFEIQLADLRDASATALKNLAKQIADTKPAATEDAQAAAIAKIASVVWLTVDASAAASFLGVLIFLLVELGATVPAAYAARMVPPAPLPTPPRPADVPASLPRLQVVDAPVPQETARQKSVPRASSARGVDLLRVVEKYLTGEAIIPAATLGTDGWIYVSQQSLAEHVGVSKAAVNRQAKVLKEAGRLLVETGPAGTRIKLPGFSVPNMPVSQALTLN